MLSSTSHRRRHKRPSGITASRKFVSFVWNHERFAIAIEQIQYILKDVAFSGKLENGCSLVEHNDEIITLIDLADLFPGKATHETGRYLIVCNVEQQKIGIAVNPIPVILEVSADQFSSIPAIYQNQLRSEQFKLGVVKSLLRTPQGESVFYLELGSHRASVISAD